MSKPLAHPPLPPTTPPGVVPGQRRQAWEAILGKPDLAAVVERDPSTAEPTLEAPVTLKATGAAPLKLERKESAAGSIRPLVELRRNGVVKGYLALDGNDDPCITNAAGTKVEVVIDEGAVQTHHDAAAAAVHGHVAMYRDGTLRAYLGLTASDYPAIIDTDGTTLLAYYDGSTGAWKSEKMWAVTSLRAGQVKDSGDIQILTVQQPAVNDAIVAAAGGLSGGSAASADPVPKADYDALVGAFNALVTDYNTLVADTATMATEFNALLGRLRTHGLIAT